MDSGTSAVDNVGDLVEFGSCGTAAKMQRRGVVRRHVLQRGGTDDKCRHTAVLMSVGSVALAAGSIVAFEYWLSGI